MMEEMRAQMAEMKARMDAAESKATKAAETMAQVRESALRDQLAAYHPEAMDVIKRELPNADPLKPDDREKITNLLKSRPHLLRSGPAEKPLPPMPDIKPVMPMYQGDGLTSALKSMLAKGPGGNR